MARAERRAVKQASRRLVLLNQPSPESSFSWKAGEGGGVNRDEGDKECLEMLRDIPLIPFLRLAQIVQ